MQLIGFYVRNIDDKSKQTLFPCVTMITQKILPILSVEEQKQKDIISLANKILSLKATYPKADTSAIETQIDELVYKTYELTEE